jgi:predicted esterase
VAVPLPSGDPHRDWMMRETEPLVDPDDAARPLTIAFHSLCFDPQWTCDWFRPGDLAPQWQLCPRAPTPCGGGGYRWDAGPRDMRRLVDLSLAAVKERHGARVRDDGTVLVGYSNGASAVVALVHAIASQATDTTVPLKGVVLFGAEVELPAAELRALGMRVGLTAGDLDGSSNRMRAQADSLQRQGVEARFVSLGRVGHVIPQSTSPAIGKLVDWVRGDSAPPVGGVR